MRLQEAEARRVAEGMAEICREMNIYHREIESRGYTSSEHGMRRQAAMLEGYEKALNALGVPWLETMGGNSDFYWSVEVGGVRISVDHEAPCPTPEAASTEGESMSTQLFHCESMTEERGGEEHGG